MSRQILFNKIIKILLFHGPANPELLNAPSPQSRLIESDFTDSVRHFDFIVGRARLVITKFLDAPSRHYSLLNAKLTNFNEM